MDDTVPRYFADFAQRNAEQHQELAVQIAAVKAGQKVFMAGAFVVGLPVLLAAGKYLLGI